MDIKEFEDYKSGDRKDLVDVATIEETIEQGAELDVTHYNVSYLRKLYGGEGFEDIDYPSGSIVEDYIEELKNLSLVTELSDEEYARYYMRPDLFCHDLYDNKDLDFVIMAINDMYTEKDFVKRHNLRYIDPENIDEALSYIIDAEEDTLQFNRDFYEDHNY